MCHGCDADSAPTWGAPHTQTAVMRTCHPTKQQAISHLQSGHKREPTRRPRRTLSKTRTPCGQPIAWSSYSELYPTPGNMDRMVSLCRQHADNMGTLPSNKCPRNQRQSYCHQTANTEHCPERVMDRTDIQKKILDSYLVAVQCAHSPPRSNINHAVCVHVHVHVHV